MTAMMIEAAVRGLLLAIVVGMGLRVLRVTNVPVRKAAWSLVLVASLAMPFLMRWPAMTGLAKGVAWVVPVHRMAALTAATPQLPATVTPTTARSTEGIPAAGVPVVRRAREKRAAAVAPAIQAVRERNEAGGDLPLAAPVAKAVPVATELAPRHARQWPPVKRLLVWVYLAVGGGLLLRLLWGLGAAAWLWARADEVSPLDVPEERVRVSDRIPSPVTIGSGIVLPVSFREWDRKKLRAVLAHERSHVRQMDFYLQLLAGIYTAIFWFSPLGWWLKRTLSQLGEAISDRAGLEAAASRSDYAGVLLEFAAGTQRALPGVAMARKGNLSRRVEQMLDEQLFRRAFAEGRRRAAVSLLLVPAALFAVTALVRVPRVAAQTETTPQTSAEKPSAPVVQDSKTIQQPAAQSVAGQSNPPDAQVTTIEPDTQNPAVSPAPPASPEPLVPQDAAPAPEAAPAPQVAPQAVPGPVTPGSPAVAPASPEPPSDDDIPMTLDMPQVTAMPDMKIVLPKNPGMPIGKVMLDMMGASGPGNGFYLIPNGGAHGYAYYFSSNGDSWAIVDGAGRNFSMGSGSDKQQLDLAQRMAKGPFLWFSHEGKSYIVDDPAIVARIRSFYAPMKDLAARQEALEVQQRVMARIDAEAARQERTDASVKIPDLSKEMADAQAALNSLKLEQGQMLSEEKLAEMQSKLAEVEARLGRLQAQSAMENNFAERMRAMGEQQQTLGEQERQLGEQQKALAKQAQQQAQTIIQECLRNGKATPVK